MPGTTPAVETVIRRSEMVRPRMSIAGRKADRFNSGSPTPLNTTRQPPAGGADDQHLRHDLAGGEVAPGAPEAGDAEAARQGASGLAGNAERAAPAIGNVDGFDGGAVVEAEKILAGGVGRRRARGDLRP